MADLTPEQIATDAIGLFLEYRDIHGYDEARAQAQAIADVVEGASVDMDQLRREQFGSRN